ncbi:Mss4-like protein [Cyathus striatus]|nr:Mss4-like protein [Cyathus striatus]
MPHKGSCLCKQTEIVLDSTHENQIVCHCLDCKETSGSAFSTNVLAPKSQVHITGPVKTYDIVAPSGNTVTRVFCGNCGSAISHLSVFFGDAQAIQTGNFRDFKDIPINTELFVKDRWTGVPAFPDAAQVHAMP